MRTETPVQVACQLAPASIHRQASSPLLAPAWHTRALVVLLLVVPLAGLALVPQTLPVSESRALSSYLPSVLVSSALAGYVARFGLPGSILRDLVGRPWDSKRRVLEDAALAAGLSFFVIALDAVLTRILAAPESVFGHALLPVTPADRAAWCLFAVAAGVGEELVYRGYLQKQLAALSQRPGLGLALQALLFGIAHGEHGGAVVARFALYGALFGVLAVVRRSLLPGMLAHVAIDLYAAAGG